ncbi:MAG: hypothetical protein OXC92_06245 [Flavobacteriaceae bacterium]|nr:hypothetical protein [Flavobacteriaceae bacterium]MCY4216564.1 hypothetical protein [Flavobacteriaceae bacterium]MCY4254315.1 hypothetical protein [Flavobacteriaceae bacterium]
MSEKHQEDLVCVAGISVHGEWIRIYPVTRDFLEGLKSKTDIKSYKYSWIELDLEKRKDKKDFRPDSYSPTNNISDLKVIDHIDTKYN